MGTGDHNAGGKPCDGLASHRGGGGGGGRGVHVVAIPSHFMLLKLARKQNLPSLLLIIRICI